MSGPGGRAPRARRVHPRRHRRTWSRAGRACATGTAKTSRPSARASQSDRPRANHRHRRYAMKALKTVAVALGITLAALIVIPLAVLAGLFVWLKLTEEDDEEILELDQEDRPADRPGPSPRTQTPAGPAGVELSGSDSRAHRPTRVGTAGLPSSASWSSWSSGRATSSSSRARSAILPPVGVHVPALPARGDHAAAPAALARGRDPPAARRRRADPAPRGHRVRLLPDPLAGRAPDDPGRRLGTAHRDDPGDDARCWRWPSAPTRRTRSSSSARSSRSSAWPWSSPPARASTWASRSSATCLTLGGRGVLGDLHGVRGGRSCVATRRSCTTTWAIVAGTVFMAPLGIAQLASRRPVRACDLGRPDRAGDRSTRGRSRPASRTWSCSTA